MAEVVLCPDAASLREIALGHLPAATAADMIAHIAKCPHCTARLESMVAVDPLVEAVTFKEDAPHSGEAEGVRRLLERMRVLFAETSGHAADQTQDEPAAACHADTPNPSSTDASDPSAEPDDGLAPPRAPGELGWLGTYRILQVLGEGGMGKVYLAEDPALKRHVALKVMKRSLARNANSHRRFLQEAQTAATLEHDNIIPIYQVGEDRGIPFLAMPLLKGLSLEDLLRRPAPLTLKQTLRLGIQIAEGLAAAHGQGLIHRDIKPANIWVEPTGGGRVKILDFGLARSTEGETGLTQSGAILGTPAYMPPEQARGEKVDHRVDLYSLGCVLYRMTTGDLPLKGNDTMGMLMALALQEPTAPSMVRPDVPKALSDLIMQLLAKDPARRPGNAKEVVQALRAIDRGDTGPTSTEVLSPSLLQPAENLPMAHVLPSSDNAFAVLQSAALQRAAAPAAGALPAVKRAPRRRSTRPVVYAGVGLIGLCLVVLGGFGIMRISMPEGDFVFKTDDPSFKLSVNKDTVLLEDTLKKKTYKLKVLKQKSGEFELEVADPAADLVFNTKTFTIKRGETVALKAWFERKQIAAVNPPVKDNAPANPLDDGVAPWKPVPVGQSPYDKLDPKAIPESERFPWQPKGLVAVLGEHRGRHWGRIFSVAFAADGKTIACAGGGIAQLFDAATLQPTLFLSNSTLQEDRSIHQVAYTADGKVLVTCSGWGGGVWLWDVDGPEPKRRHRITSEGAELSMRLSADGKTLAIGGLDNVRLWDLSGEKRKQRAGIKGLKPFLSSLVLSPDGKTLAVVESDNTKVRLWDLSGEQPKEGAAILARSASSFTPDSKTLAVSGANGVEFWDLRGEQPKKGKTLPGAGGGGVFSRDGKKFVCAGQLGTLLVYDLSGLEPSLYGKIPDWPRAMDFSPDGKFLATGGEFGPLRLWDLTDPDIVEKVPAKTHTGSNIATYLSPDGKLLATTSDSQLFLWKLTGAAPQFWAELRGHTHGIPNVDFSSDGKTLASCSPHLVQLWDLTGTEPAKRTRVRPGKEDNWGAGWVGFSSDGKSLACYRDEKGPALWLWDLSGPELKQRAVVKDCPTPFCIMPEGKIMIGASRNPKGGLDGTLGIFDIGGAAPQDHGRFHEPTMSPAALTRSPDGKVLAAWRGGDNPNVSLLAWDGTQLTFLGNINTEVVIRSIAFAPDNRTLAVAHYLGVSLWDVQQARKTAEVRIPGPVYRVSFAPDGRHLITSNANATAYVLRVP